MDSLLTDADSIYWFFAGMAPMVPVILIKAVMHFARRGMNADRMQV